MIIGINEGLKDMMYEHVQVHVHVHVCVHVWHARACLELFKCWWIPYTFACEH